MKRPNFVPTKTAFAYLIVTVIVTVHLLSQLVNCQYQEQQESEDSISRIRRQIQEQILKLTGAANQTNASSSSAPPLKTNDKFNLIEPDANGLYIVGLFDVHQSSPRNPFKCGGIDLDAGEQQSRRPLQNLIAFQWAIEQVNADKMLLPGVRLGALMMDTCSSFLRTNQQLANLLHESSDSGSISPRQMLAIVADNHDWQSVEATVSMASALGLTTFVTQSKSTKLTDLARKYLPTNQLDYSTDARLSETQMERNLKSSESQMQHQFEGFLSELLGIGKMTTPASQSFHTHETSNGASNDSFAPAPYSPLNLDLMSTESQNSQNGASHSKLLMVRMLLGNELLAEAIASLAQQMNWDYLSLISDDSLDMVDLHDELARQLFSRNIQLALDEQVPSLNNNNAIIGSTSPSEVFDKLLLSLAKKSTSGSRVVITLLGTGSSRNLLDSLHKLRQSSKSQATSLQLEQIKQINSLLWVTISDREPYYSFATDALGTIGISSSSSLIPEFKNYYDKLASGDLNSQQQQASSNSNSNNKWWPEYIKSILLRHKKEVELISNECAKWQEPKASPLQDQCRALTLSSLVQAERRSVTLNGSLSGNNNSNNNNKSLRGKSSQFKLNKYLAGGWEHNGMDVINSVLAIANGLESIRQTLCPEVPIGICDRMRELVHPSSPISLFANEKDLPKLSELIYNELLRSTFQLADGRMFNLDDFNSLGGLVEGKLKLYNLRYLQQNSIGFVKFGHFDQHEGLTLNVSKAKYYPESNFATQLPLDKLKSSCEDETKCLMLQTMQLGGSGGPEQQQQQQDNSTSGGQRAANSPSAGAKGPISEEELAAGVNSLFKLDHPQFVWQHAAGNGNGAPTGGSTTIDNNSSSVVANQQQVVLSELDSHVRTMRSPIGFVVGVGVHHNNHQQQQQQQLGGQQESSSHEQSSERLQKSSAAAASRESANSSTLLAPQPMERQTFDTIVLLPLHHRGYQSLASLPTSSSEATICSTRLDVGHSFQHLVALAYAQTLVNSAELSQAHLSSGDGGGGGHLLLAHPRNFTNQDHDRRSSSLPTGESTSLNGRSDKAAEQQIELTTTVIDYCDSIELAKTKLAAKLATSSRSVAVIDFDVDVGESISPLVSAKNLLHITIGLPKAPTRHHHQVRGNGDERRAIGKTPQAVSAAQPANHLHVSLLPSKSNEIEALVKLLSKIPQATTSSAGQPWKLVHLIYTDHHHYRDEFVRLANEANICVSKLIWIPAPPEASPTSGFADGNSGVNAEQLQKTRQLFSSELYDFYGSPKQQAKLDPNSSQDLNATRILVVLASENPLTNRLILEAASDSMLDHYVWLTSHEWLASVELAAEMSAGAAADATSGNNAPSGNRLPRNFVSTRLESIETHGFRKFYSQLTPAIHSPLPTSWFDEFWQQQFRCKLPIPNSHHTQPTSEQQQQQATRASGNHNNVMTPLCQPNQHLSAHHLVEDDRVHYTVRAIESLHFALKSVANVRAGLGGGEGAGEANNNQEQGINQNPEGARLLASEFRQSFENSTSSGGSGGLNRKLRSPFGLHIVHRLLPPPVDGESGGGGRRANSRDLSPLASQGQLETVGLWRNGELILWAQSDGISNRLAAVSSSGEELDVESKISKSLHQLAQVRSRCVTPKTCDLCRAQIQQTIALLKQEEARLKQSESVTEPKAISSIWQTFSTGASVVQGQGRGPQTQESPQMQDSILNPAFEDPDQSLDKAPNQTSGNSSSSSVQQDEIQASASSLFDDSTAKEVERQRQADMRRAYNQMIQQQRRDHRGLGGPNSISLMTSSRLASGLLVSLLSLAGVVCVVLSMTYFYPTMLLVKPRRSDSMTSITSASVYGSKLQIISRSNSPDQLSCDSSLNDYFLLTGLLMLFSINMAMLLPATVGVCYFKRFGLATSYSVIFSSILVKILALNRKNSIARKQDEQANVSNSFQDNNHRQPAAIYPIDPIEESVEVTFESLPHDPQLNEGQVVERQQQHQHQHSNATIISNGYQTRNSVSPAPSPIEFSDVNSSGRPMTLWVSLVIGQLIVSTYWLYRQPPEPTLYMGCWHCSSPTRSPVVFLYEPLMSLIFPASVLILAWISSIYSFKSSAKNEERYRVAVKRLLLSNNKVNWQSSSQRQELLDSHLRDAKSLIMTTTLLILTWSLMTLKLISQSRKLSPSTLSSTLFPGLVPNRDLALQDPDQQLQSSAIVSDDFTLVYANIISGTIIFVFLFIYRFQLFGYISSVFCCRGHRRGTKKFINRSPGESNSQVLKFNQTNQQVNGGSLINKWLPHQPEAADLTLFSQSDHLQAAPSRNRERLKLQQFNSSYGTYSLDSQSNSMIDTHIAPASVVAAAGGSGSKKAKKSKSKKSAASTGDARLEDSATQLNGNEAHISNSKLQRRQSNNSNASSTARLVSSNNFLDPEDSFMDLDTISCASSVASSSTSQLQGNDLYPIDCSLQLDSAANTTDPQAANSMSSLSRSASFNRRSLRRSSMNKLSLVHEGQEVVNFKAPDE